MSLDVIAAQLPEIKDSLKDAAELISEALCNSPSLEVSAQIETFEILTEVLSEASCSFYLLCAAESCHGCLLSLEVVPAFLKLVNCSTRALYVPFTSVRSFLFAVLRGR